ncbi:hypothetical protein PSEUDO8O_120743 [Pseudomonas sp. 8O]|nr:hypothetical protein PSEUDO8O_120743 [Pseudomonas sp. 8O]
MGIVLYILLCAFLARVEGLVVIDCLGK